MKHPCRAAKSTPRPQARYLWPLDHARTDRRCRRVHRQQHPRGVICVNQCPLLGGINDDATVLGQMYRELSFIGCPPYYLFQGRPTAGNAPFRVPIVRGWQIFREAMRMGSGLARRARFVMSHETGKIEIVGVDGRYIYLRYHRAHEATLRGRFMRYLRNDEACWFDDHEPARSGGPDQPRLRRARPLWPRVTPPPAGLKRHPLPPAGQPVSLSLPVSSLSPSRMAYA